MHAKQIKQKTGKQINHNGKSEKRKEIGLTSKQKLSETKMIATKKSWLVSTLYRINTSYTKPTSKSMFSFENNLSAAKENSRILERFNFDLHKAALKDENSIIQPGTEFRDIETIQPLIDCHKNKESIKNIITKGASYPINLLEYNEETRKEDLNAAITKGNNKSAMHPDSISALRKAYDKEVNRGWMLPIELNALKNLKGAGVIPIGCATQATVDDKGNRTQKKRTTHDCSQANKSGFSVNNACDKEALEECIYGYCLLRLLHNIHFLRVKYPTTPIYMNKTDLDAAFRRIHVILKFALLCTTIIGSLAYILFRLPFGSSPAPSKFCTISEFIIDLAQQLVQDISWNPSTLQTPDQHLIPETQKLYSSKTK